ncbi:hypothetical protein M0R45_000518 [Rubus argutus]|uniref:ABC transporter domain-containing protein n=1 Tax=Rubus argutus TaxID=59490 RepID=A0AAW1VPW1_RUBAR
MTTYAEVESVTLGPLHYDNMTASTEEVQVDGYPVFDYSDHGTEGLSDYDVFGNTTGSVSDIATFEEKDHLEIGVADIIGEVEVDLYYEEVDEEAEAQFDIEALEENGQPEIEAAENIIDNDYVDNDYEELSLISVLIGSTTFSHVKKGNSLTSNRVIPIHHQSLPTTQLNASPDVPCSTAHNFQDIPFSWNWNKEPWHSAMSCFRKSSLHHLTGLEASAEDETQEKRGATVAVCQQPVLTNNLNAGLIVPASFHERLSSWSWITESCHSEMNSLQNGLYEAESQEMSGAGRTLEESPWIPQWAYSYGSFTTFDPNKNRYVDDAEVVTPQPHHLYGNFTTDEKIPIKNLLHPATPRRKTGGGVFISEAQSKKCLWLVQRLATVVRSEAVVPAFAPGNSGHHFSEFRKPPLPRLLLNNVSCMRNAQQILRHVNATVHDGGALVLMGTNGSGKTTFLRMLAGFSKPSAGQVLWNGHDITDSGVFHQYKLQLNWLSLKDAVKEKFTVLDNVQWFEVLEGKMGNSLPALELMGLADWQRRRRECCQWGSGKGCSLRDMLDRSDF